MDGDEDGDGSDGTGEEPVGAFDPEQLSSFDAERGDRDDDKTDASLPIGELIDELPDAPDTSPEAADAAEEVNTGDGDIAFSDEASGEDDDAEGIDGDDVTQGIDALSDLGEDDEREGTDEPLEDEVDESAFPQLDADEQGGDADNLDIGEIDLPDEVPVPDWSEVRWERVEMPLVAVPMRHVACSSRCVAAAGDGAVVLAYEDDAPPACRFLPLEGHGSAELVGIVLQDPDGRRLLLATRHRLMVSADAGRQVRVVADVLDEGPEAEITRMESAARGAGFAYACTSKGRLLVSSEPARGWRPIDGVGLVRSIAVDEGGTAHVLARRDGQLHWLRSDEEGRWEGKALQGIPQQLPEAPAPVMAVRGTTWVIASPTGMLIASLDAGETWQQTRLPTPLRSVTVVPGDEGHVVVGAFYVESEDRSYLFSWRPGAQPERVADLSPDVTVGTLEIDPSDGLGRAHHVRWDPIRGCVWVAGSFGLCAWRPALPA